MVHGWVAREPEQAESGIEPAGMSRNHSHRAYYAQQEEKHNIDSDQTQQHGHGAPLLSKFIKIGRHAQSLYVSNKA